GGGVRSRARAGHRPPLPASCGLRNRPRLRGIPHGAVTISGQIQSLPGPGHIEKSPDGALAVVAKPSIQLHPNRERGMSEGSNVKFSEAEALEFHTMGRPGKIEIIASKPMATQR